MADITRLSRFVGGLPRDVDLTTNTPQVLSLKVGTTTPAELTKSMVELLNTINTTGLPSANLSAGAKQSTLESKIAAFRVGVLNYVPTTGNSSDTVTTEVLGAAATDTAIGAGGAISAAAAKGIFVGTVSGASDVGKVLIRVNGTDNGFDDGSGDEIYGVLTESSGVYTLNYKKADGTAYTVTASDTTAKMDFYFIEVMDLYSFGVDRLLMPAIGGVVDATTASSVYAETSAREVADSSLYAALDVEMSDRIAADDLEASTRFEVDCSLYAAIDVEFSARLESDSSLNNAMLEADSSLFAAIDVEYSARLDADSSLYALLGDGSEADSSLYAAIADADSSLYAAIAAEASVREAADSSLYAAVGAEASVRDVADSSLFAAVDLEYSARLASDSSLQAELDLTQGSLGDAISGTGGWLGFSGTNYLNAELTITASMEKLDAVIYGESTTRLAADSSLYAAIDVEYSARLDADSSLYALVGGGSEADSSLYAAIEAEASVRFEVDCSLYAALEEADSSLSAVMTEADSSLYAAIEAEASVRFEVDCSLAAVISEADSSLFAAIEAEASVRYEVDCSLYAALEEADSSLVAAMNVADSSLYAALDLEASTRYEVDSSLQVELDVTQGSIGDAMNGDGSWSGFSGTNYLDSELTITNGLIALDTAVYGESTARQVADSSLQAQINALNVSVVDVQYTAAAGGIAAGDVVALSLTVVGEVIKADATGIATCETVVGVALETATAGNPVMVRTFGEAPVTNDGNNFDLGKRVYSHTTAGQASKTPPSTTNNVVYLVGGATATNKVFVNTNLEYVVS